MKKLWLILIKDILAKFKGKILTLVLLMVVNGLLEGIGLALLFPLLTMVGIGQPGAANPIANVVRDLFSKFGLPVELKVLLLVIIGVFLTQVTLFLWQSFVAARLQHAYIYTWRRDLFRRYMHANWPFFLNTKSGELINTLTAEADRAGGAFYLTNQFVSIVCITGIYLVLSFCASWQITSVLLAAGIVLFVLTYGMVKAGYRVGKGISASQAMLQSEVNEFISGAKVIKATSSEELAEGRFQTVVEKLRNLYFQSSFQPNLLKGIFDLTAIVLLCLVLYFGTQSLNINPAVIIVVATIFVKMVPKVFSLQQNMQLLGVYLPAIETLHNFNSLALKHSETFEQPTGRRLFDSPISISFSGVSFAYDRNKILRDISADFPAGKTIGLVGVSGAGKSTLVDCILRLVNIQQGNILVQGRKLEELPLRAFRKCVGYVSQETFLFNDSIKNNIAWGLENYGQDDIITAAAKAHVQEFVQAMPAGYETVVGDRGARLSGGQKQRIGLARALINAPSLLIMDEATSALDAESEKYVLQALDTLHSHMTIIIISHRFSAVKNTDLIYLLEEGTIAEKGTWNELLAKDTRFKYLWELQNKNYTGDRH
jgi:ATP-binding cassette subfamily C protein